MTLTDPDDRAFLEIAQRDWDETLQQSFLVQKFPCRRRDSALQDRIRSDEGLTLET